MITVTGAQLNPFASVLNMLDRRGIVPATIDNAGKAILIVTNENLGVEYKISALGFLSIEQY